MIRAISPPADKCLGHLMPMFVLQSGRRFACPIAGIDSSEAYLFLTN